MQEIRRSDAVSLSGLASGDLLEEVAMLAEDKSNQWLVIESTGISEPMQVAETVSERSRLLSTRRLCVRDVNFDTFDFYS